MSLATALEGQCGTRSSAEWLRWQCCSRHRAARTLAGGGGRGYGSNNYNGIIAAALIVAGVDVGLTLWDGGSALASHHPSTGYGVFELTVAAPQVALGVAAMGSAPGGGGSSAPIYTIWMGAMTAHALWTIATASSATPEPPSRPLREGPPLPPSSRMSVSLGPTWVQPLGQLAHPGVGLVGRF